MSRTTNSQKWLGPVLKLSLAILLILSNVLLGFPADFLINRWNESKVVDSLYLSLKDPDVVDEKRALLPTFGGRAKAANFSMQTGYYTGNGSTQAISGLGFQPQTVIIKSDTAAGQAIWKTSSMPANTTAFFSATAVATSTLITLSANGFSVANNGATNTANVRYTWTAFAGSDCTSSGTVCVGSYTGNGAATRKIVTGFQPAFAMVKRSTAVAANFRTTSMPANTGNYLNTTAQNTSGGLFTTLDSDGFTVGSAVNNVNTGVYYYVAFKAVSGIMAVGTYSGNATDNRSITGFGAGSLPNFAIVKNANSITAANTSPYMANTHAYGDYSNKMDTATVNAVNMVQKLQDNGIQVGSGLNVNESGRTIYWAAFGGAPPPPAASDTFEMATGSYSGNGTSQSVSGLDFAPDLIIVKDSAANQSVFRTSLMAGNNTAYFATNLVNFSGGITALNSSGFSVGSNATVNTVGNTYHWQAFGNAYKPTTGTGAADFTIGAYTGNGLDNRNVTNLPFQPDLVAMKRNGATFGVWRSSASPGDLTNFYSATGEGNNRIQALNTDGFQIGTNPNSNTLNSIYNWFAFKNGDNFTTGSYTGTGSAQTVNTGFRPDLAWVKSTTTVNGVARSESLAGDSTQYFINLANINNRITGFAANGFTIGGNQTETNTNAGTYRYAVWRVPETGVLSFDIVDSGGTSVPSPNYTMPEGNLSFGCENNLGTLGTSSQKLRVTNTTSTPGWILSIAATDGSTGLWRNGGNTEQYDYNDSSGSPVGCSDGGDTDSKAGKLTIDPSAGTNTPQGGCSAANVGLGSTASFLEGSINSITLATANSSAQTGCYWDLTSIGLSQYIPSEQPVGTYTINLTLTIIAQ